MSRFSNANVIFLTGGLGKSSSIGRYQGVGLLDDGVRCVFDVAGPSIGSSAMRVGLGYVDRTFEAHVEDDQK